MIDRLEGDASAGDFGEDVSAVAVQMKRWRPVIERGPGPPPGMAEQVWSVVAAVNVESPVRGISPRVRPQPLAQTI